MIIEFTKMNGAGNDFVVIDCMTEPIAFDTDQIAFLCDRKRGIGADGILLLEPDPAHDFRMRYYNRDGGEAGMCGNGARCLAHIAANRGLGVADGEARKIIFTTNAGTMKARVTGNRVALEMSDAFDLSLNLSLQVENRDEIVHFINTGVPHVVMNLTEVDTLEDDYINSYGNTLRNNPRFLPEGCNVNFASCIQNGSIQIRTYERGVEQETLACGTGAVATAIIFGHLGLALPPVRLLTRGGDDLSVSFSLDTGGAREVVLDGPAKVNFNGTITI